MPGGVSEVGTLGGQAPALDVLDSVLDWGKADVTERATEEQLLLGLVTGSSVKPAWRGLLLLVLSLEAFDHVVRLLDIWHQLVDGTQALHEKLPVDFDVVAQAGGVSWGQTSRG
jgi:hypothetical protein